MIHDCPICWFRNELWGMMGLAGLEDHFHRAHIQWWGDMTPVWPLSVKGPDFRYLEQGNLAKVMKENIRGKKLAIIAG